MMVATTIIILTTLVLCIAIEYTSRVLVKQKTKQYLEEVRNTQNIKGLYI